jgi:tRNA-dihydrouridine synthase B
MGESDRLNASCLASATQSLAGLLDASEPVLALAPMQDVTDWAFLALISQYGGADLYVTEYFRVFRGSCLNRHILRSITENPTGKPVLAQMIGNDVPELVRTAKQLQQYPVAGIDLNLGCPAPVVYRKQAGGGLLREPKMVDAILGALRDAIRIPFTVKTRIGFDDARVFDELLPIFARHSLDLLTVHARTVKELYRSEVHYEFVRRAVSGLQCPVLANGNVFSPVKAREVLDTTGARGVMIGRAAIRNPWLFAQIRAHLAGRTVPFPTGRDVLTYIAALQEAAANDNPRELSQVQRLKKFTNYIGIGIDPDGAFLHRIRRVTKMEDFFAVCREFLDHDRAMPLEPFPLDLHERDVMAGEHC